MDFKSKWNEFIDRLIGAMIFIIMTLCIWSLGFFYTLPIQLVGLVPFDIFFLIYFILAGIVFWAAILAPRRLWRNDVVKFLRSFEFAIYPMLSIAIIITIMHWNISKRFCFLFYRKFIPYLDEMLGYK